MTMDGIVRLVTIRTFLTALAVTGLVAVGGCSSGPAGDSAVNQTAVASPTERATSSPAPLTAKQAAVRYLAIVKPYNVALESLEQAVNSGRPIATLRTSAAKVAAANKTQIRGLADTKWPAAVRAPIKELQAESLKAQPYWLEAAKAQTQDALIQQVLKAARHDGADAGNKIRHLLDLGKYDESDYS
ncbi:hypothetical protein GCM10023193_12270 [Planotetraspora kaengkrachanensis]|uniref:Uncharacterized protein n=2 Tax=Planotetraspora kaengkrachanensis TaxID=575193 RepID=A0A8J3V9P1_9ACTN|nr:hypothetical protein Pka01_53710 [Planotetraspora kaengkrachanensis]